MPEISQQPQKRVKKSVRQKVHFPWLFCVALLITVFIASRAWGVLDKKANAREMNNAYREELVQLDKKEGSMQQELQELQTPAGVEREIREKFRVTQPGEELVVVVPSEQADGEEEREGKGLFHFLRNIFAKKEQENR